MMDWSGYGGILPAILEIVLTEQITAVTEKSSLVSSTQKWREFTCLHFEPLYAFPIVLGISEFSNLIIKCM